MVRVTEYRGWQGTDGEGRMMAPADSHNRAASASPWRGVARPQAAWRSRRWDSSHSHGLRNHHCRPPVLNPRASPREHRECHIEPDWLLIYRTDEEELALVDARTGNHSELLGLYSIQICTAKRGDNVSIESC